VLFDIPLKDMFSSALTPLRHQSRLYPQQQQQYQHQQQQQSQQQQTSSSYSRQSSTPANSATSSTPTSASLTPWSINNLFGNFTMSASRGGGLFNSYSKFPLNGRHSTGGASVNGNNSAPFYSYRKGNSPRKEKLMSLRRSSLNPIYVDQDTFHYMEQVFVNEQTPYGKIRLNHYMNMLTKYALPNSMDTCIIEEICRELRQLSTENPELEWNSFVDALRNQRAVTRIQLPSTLSQQQGTSSVNTTPLPRRDVIKLSDYASMLKDHGIISPIADRAAVVTPRATPRNRQQATEVSTYEHRTELKVSEALRSRINQLDQMYANISPLRPAAQNISTRIDELVAKGHSAQAMMLVDEDEGPAAHVKTMVSHRFVPIDEKDMAKASAALKGPRSGDILQMKYNIDITREKFSCLRPQTWLNDEV
jgi:hypothetical protein